MKHQKIEINAVYFPQHEGLFILLFYKIFILLSYDKGQYCEYTTANLHHRYLAVLCAHICVRVTSLRAETHL